jgi:hypothetical protein
VGILRDIAHRRRRAAARALAALALAVAAGATAFTGASMTDGSKASAALSAGTAGLTVSNDGKALIAGTSAMTPGASATASTTLTSSGDIAETVVLGTSQISDAPASPGLSTVLTVTVKDHTSGTQLWSGTVAALSGGATLATLQPGAAKTLDVTLSWPSAARDAGLQGATTSFHFVWRAAS